MSDAQTPSPEPAKKYWWAAGIVVPIIVALIGLVSQWHKQEVHLEPPPIEAPARNPGSVGTLLWSLPMVGFILGAGVVSGIVAVIGDDLPTPVLVLFAIFGAGFAIWAAVSTSSDPPKGPLPVMIFLAVSGISMLRTGSRAIRGTYALAPISVAAPL